MRPMLKWFGLTVTLSLASVVVLSTTRNATATEAKQLQGHDGPNFYTYGYGSWNFSGKWDTSISNGTVEQILCSSGINTSGTLKTSGVGTVLSSGSCVHATEPTHTDTGYLCSDFTTTACVQGDDGSGNQVIYDGGTLVASVSDTDYAGNPPDKASCVNHASWGCAVSPTATSTTVCGLTNAKCKAVCASGLFDETVTQLCGSSFSGDPGFSDK